MTIVTMTERIMMNKGVKNDAVHFIFVGHGPHALKILWVPRRHCTNSFDRQWSLHRCSAGPDWKQSAKCRPCL